MIKVTSYQLHKIEITVDNITEDISDDEIMQRAMSTEFPNEYVELLTTCDIVQSFQCRSVVNNIAYVEGIVQERV